MKSCILPWSRLHFSRYSCSVCCYTGADGKSVRGVPVGAVRSMWDIWNSPSMQTMRQEMSSHGYSKVCSTKENFDCPESTIALNSTRLLTKHQLKNYQNIAKNYQEGRTIVDCYPAHIQVVLDYKCNLNCSHCFQFVGRNSTRDYGLQIMHMSDLT